MNNDEEEIDYKYTSSTWMWVWGALAAFVVSFIAYFDIRATSSSIYNTLSYVGSVIFVEHPQVVGAIVGIFGGHMGMPGDRTPRLDVFGQEAINFLFLVLVFSAVWEPLRMIGLVDEMPNWAMLINLNLWIITAYYVWPLRPS